MKKNPFLESFRPFIADTVTSLRELTVSPLLVGTVLGMIFGASSLHLALKTGLTVSASIPVAVIAITLFKSRFSQPFLGSPIYRNRHENGRRSSIRFIQVTSPTVFH
jgi:uncharacterized oligopeptide transporter (OPT) family protein